MSAMLGRGELIAAALSAHTGVKIQSEREAEAAFHCGLLTDVRFLLDMREIFYGKYRVICGNDKHIVSQDSNSFSKSSTDWGQTGLHAAYYINDKDLSQRLTAISQIKGLIENSVKEEAMRTLDPMGGIGPMFEL